jgi:hypothetical protein
VLVDKGALLAASHALIKGMLEAMNLTSLTAGPIKT